MHDILISRFVHSIKLLTNLSTITTTDKSPIFTRWLYIYGKGTKTIENLSQSFAIFQYVPNCTSKFINTKLAGIFWDGVC